MVLNQVQHNRNKYSQTEGEPSAVWLWELLSDLIDLFGLVETSWLCSPGSNHIYCCMPLVGKSIIVLAIRDKYIYKYVWCWRRLYIFRNIIKSMEAVWVGELLGAFMSLMETSFALLSCSPGSNSLFCSIHSENTEVLNLSAYKKDLFHPNTLHCFLWKIGRNFSKSSFSNFLFYFKGIQNFIPIYLNNIRTTHSKNCHLLTR